MSINIRAKGQRAERKVIELLQPVVNEVYTGLGITPLNLERNLMQSHKGGYDVVGIDWLAIEVKHQETLALDNWWAQTLRQAKEGQTPVLFYKTNGRKFTVRIIGYLNAGATKIKTPVDIPIDTFLIYFRHRLLSELGGSNGQP